MAQSVSKCCPTMAELQRYAQSPWLVRLADRRMRRHLRFCLSCQVVEESLRLGHKPAGHP